MLLAQPFLHAPRPPGVFVPPANTTASRFTASATPLIFTAAHLPAVVLEVLDEEFRFRDFLALSFYDFVSQRLGAGIRNVRTLASKDSDRMMRNHRLHPGEVTNRCLAPDQPEPEPDQGDTADHYCKVGASTFVHVAHEEEHD